MTNDKLPVYTLNMRQITSNKHVNSAKNGLLLKLSAAPSLVNFAIHHRIFAGLSLALYRNSLMERHGKFSNAIILTKGVSISSYYSK